MVEKKRFWSLVSLFLLLFVVKNGFAQSDANVFPPKPNPAVFVHDYAGWLTPDEKMRLETRLQFYEDSTSNEIVVMIRPDIGDFDKATYAIELLNRWGVGKKGKDNGVVMLIKTTQPQRGVFIASGWGAEGPLPDVVISRIIRDEMIPLFKQEQNFQGIERGIDLIQKAIRGEFHADPPSAAGSWIPLLIILLFFLVFIFIFYRISKKMGTTYSGKGASRRSIYGGGWGGGWGSGGGFGGGSSGGWGGSSGGSGGWSSGGFGGGSSGGGGAGGDW